MQFTFKSRGWGVVKRAFPLNYLCFAEFRFAARGGSGKEVADECTLVDASDVDGHRFKPITNAQLYMEHS